MLRIFKIIPAAVLFCALSWNAATLAQVLLPAPKNILDINVSVTCSDGDATFTVTNKGETWPGVGNLSVYSTEATKLVHQRRMRFTAGQRATFRVPGVAADNLEFGLWVDPSWGKREFAYDAKITCG